MAEKKRRGAPVKEAAEKKERFPMKMKKKNIDWIRANVPEGKWNEFVERAVEVEIERVSGLVG